MKNLILLITTCLIGLASCNNKPTLGKMQNEQGQTIKEFYFIGDSILHGPMKGYDDEGILFEEATYENGQLEGIRTIYFPNGNKEIVENYVGGELNGPYITYYDNGKENLIANFVSGTMTGKVMTYYESGKLKEELTFENNEENGPFKEYFENGQVEWEGTYLNGDNEFGLLLNYDKEGNIVKKMQCDSNAICQTIWTPETGDIPLKELFIN